MYGNLTTHITAVQIVGRNVSFGFLGSLTCYNVVIQPDTIT